MNSTSTDDDQLRYNRVLSELTDDLKEMEPALLALNTGTVYNKINTTSGRFPIPFWGEEFFVSYPEFYIIKSSDSEKVDLFTQVFLTYYFHTADGTRMSGKWISFSELDDAYFYDRAFQGYTGNVLVRTYGNILEELITKSQELGGKLIEDEPDRVGDISIRFNILPRISLLLSCWYGDEDFPSSIRILFDSSINHYLPTDVCAVLGSSITKKLVKVSSNKY